MKCLLFIVFLCTTVFTYGQDYLEKEEDKQIFTDSGEGIPSDAFSNFDLNTKFGTRVQGLLEKPYIATKAQRSTISIELKNIGRVVVYAKLFNKLDSVLHNPLSQRHGEITLIPYRDNRPIESIKSVTSFDEDISQQLHFNFRKAGIDKIELLFDSENDLFIVDKLKVIPFNEKGVSYYTELERSEKSILDLADRLEDNAAILKSKYQDQVGKIEVYYQNLFALISGNKFENLSTIKANSLNPFRNGEFIKHYEGVLDNANEQEREKIEAATKSLGTSNFKNIAVTLGNLYTGGSFSSLINLVGGIFEKSISLKGQEMPILKINSDYYTQSSLNGGKLKLAPVKDEQTLGKIKDLTKKNDAFKTYVSKIILFTKEDAETITELNKDIVVAKIIRSDFENLLWEIIGDYTELPKEELIAPSKVSFSAIGTELQKNFKTESMDMSAVLNERSKSITSIKKFNELASKYAIVTSKIKTHYDFLYENRPKERADAFEGLEGLLPGNLLLDWVKGQNSITIEYTKDDGLKDFLADATGKE